MRLSATQCMLAPSGCSSESHSHWEPGGGPCSRFPVFSSSSGASSTRKRFCAEIFGGTRNIRIGSVIVSFRIFGKSQGDEPSTRRHLNDRDRRPKRLACGVIKDAQTVEVERSQALRDISIVTSECRLTTEVKLRDPKRSESLLSFNALVE